MHCAGLGDRFRAVATLFWLAFLTNRALFIHWDKPVSLLQALLPHDVDWRPPLWALDAVQYHDVMANPNGFAELMRSLLDDTAADVVGVMTNLDGVLFLRQLFSPDAPRVPPTAACLDTIPTRVRERGACATALRWSLQAAFDLLFRPSLLLLASIEAELDEVRDAWTRYGYVWFTSAAT